MTFEGAPSHPVHWTPSADALHSAPHAGALGRRTAIDADRVAASLMLLLLFACVAVSVYDLYLLLAQLR